MTLKLAPKLVLPDDAVTQTFGILAKRGAGKSNAAAVMAEEMYAAGLPFVVVDPIGAWWGLRSSSDGKGSGLSVPIFGGYRGDVPLEPGSGNLMAELIVDENLSAVLDVSAFDSESAKRRFLADFATRLYWAKGKPGNDTPLHLFLEEADDYIPQRATGPTATMLGAFERLVKRGRARGIGVTMISQRSASLNKDVLTQIETLIVLRIVSPTDRTPIEGWVKYHGQRDDILSTLSELKPGEAWVWSPWLDLTERVQIRRRKTFDSGATPSVKAKRAVATLADVDLGAITEQMAATIERAKAEDPAELRRQVADLRRQLAAIEHKGPVPSKEPEIVKEVLEVPRFSDAQFERLVDLQQRGIDALLAYESREIDGREKLSQALIGPISKLIGDEEQLSDVLERLEARAKASPAVAGNPARGKQPGKVAAAPTAATGTRATAVASPPRPAPEPSTAAGGITGPQRRVLDAIAWLNAVGFDHPTKIQVGFIAGYRVGKAVGGTFGNILGALRSEGLIDYPAAGRVQLLGAGRAIAEIPTITPTTAGLQDAVFARLSEPERRVLQVLIDIYPDPLGKQELGSRAGYTVGPAVGGTFGNILGRLRTLGLIEYPGPGLATATSLLFLEGAA